MRPEIEVFDLSHIHGARRLVDAGLMNERPHVQFVMGVKNAMPAEEHLLDILLAELKRVLPEATWTAAGIGRHQPEVMRWVLARGADAVRTGLEDNIRVTKDRLAASNAELVRIAAEAITKPCAARRPPPRLGPARPAGSGGGASRMTFARLTATGWNTDAEVMRSA